LLLNDIVYDIIIKKEIIMHKVDKILESMKENSKNVRFEDLVKVCSYYFGYPRIRGSHYFFSVPWEGKPLTNIQKTNNGKAKVYQVEQVLKAIEKLEGEGFV
jgi:hypothetical protein